MNLWIRSQDKMKLIKVNFVFLNYKNSCQIIANYIPDFIGREGDYFETLGTYKSKERALEVLDEIQNILNPKYMIRMSGNLSNVKKYLNIDGAYIQCNDNADIKNINNNLIYEMPEE